MKRKFGLCFVYVASLITLSNFVTIAACADEYPIKPIRWINPTGPGGGLDIVARIIAPELSTGLGQPVVIDNRPGAATIIAIDLMAKAPPDGYTIVATSGSLTMNAAGKSNLPYDTEKDLAPVTMLSMSPYILVVHPSLPVKSVKELVAYAKDRPGKLNYSCSGIGSPTHILMESVKTVLGINVEPIAYKGGPPAIAAALSGEVQMCFFNPAALASYIKTGRLRALAVGSAKRTSTMPDIPTFAEAGFPGIERAPWYGVHAPARTPKPIIERLNREFVRVLRTANIKEQLLKLDQEIVANTPEEFSAIIKQEIAEWTKLFKETGIKIE